MDFCLALILYTRYSYFKCAPIQMINNLTKEEIDDMNIVEGEDEDE